VEDEMDLGLNETQQMLQDLAKDFLQRELPSRKVRLIDESESGFSRDLWEKIVEVGWTGMAIPERYGGTANSFTDLGVVFEQLGYSACTSPLLSSAVLSAQAILEAGNEDQKQNLLPAIANGTLILTFAFTEPDYAWSPASIQLQATLEGNNYLLNGTKIFVPDAHIADRLIVVARTATTENTSAGITMFIVDSDAPGVSIRLQQGWLGDKVCEVTLHDVEIPHSRILGPEGQAWPLIDRVLDRATALTCAYMVGGAQKVVDMTIDYSKTRIAFGVPIGTFQRVQDLVIDALGAADRSRWTTYEALSKLDQGRDDASIAISMAKAVASEAFPIACECAHHVHAGIGIDLDFGLPHYTKRARTFAYYLGDATHHKHRLARLLDLGSLA
jgi:alkylation response protein AidB-like acyl-CoA dehydrogenase